MESKIERHGLRSQYETRDVVLLFKQGSELRFKGKVKGVYLQVKAHSNFHHLLEDEGGGRKHESAHR